MNDALRTDKQARKPLSNPYKHLSLKQIFIILANLDWLSYVS